MNEKHGVESLKKLAKALGQLVAMAYGLIVEKTGIWNIVFGVKEPVEVLQKFFTAGGLASAKAEISDLEMPEYNEVTEALLAPMQPALQEKLRPVEDLVEKCVEVVEKVVASGKQAYVDVMDIVVQFKAIFGLK